jgi:hypothetical protein
MLKLKLNSWLFISLQPQFATIEATGDRNFIIKKDKVCDWGLYGIRKYLIDFGNSKKI